MRRLLTGLVLLAASSAPAAAQDAGDGFLFAVPRATLSIRGGLAAPTARGDLFDFVTDRFTLGRGDFRAPALDADLAIRLTQRMDLVAGASYSRSNRGSEYRHWVDNNNLPIQQTTALVRVPVTGSLRYYLLPRGRAVGSVAFIPARFVPYVGAGGGATWYRLRQEGDFIDFNTSDVFGGTFESSGWARTAVVSTGADYSIGPRVALGGQARYEWGKADLDRHFVGFDGIDLSGFALSLGFTFRL